MNKSTTKTKIKNQSSKSTEPANKRSKNGISFNILT
jgi:hypothetical protein